MPMTANHFSLDAATTDALARHIDKYQGDYPLVTFEDNGLRVIAMYKNTELDIIIDPTRPNGAQRGEHPADRYATSVMEAIRLISQIESVRQKLRHPMLRFRPEGPPSSA